VNPDRLSLSEYWGCLDINVRIHVLEVAYFWPPGIVEQLVKQSSTEKKAYMVSSHSNEIV